MKFALLSSALLASLALATPSPQDFDPDYLKSAAESAFNQASASGGGIGSDVANALETFIMSGGKSEASDVASKASSAGSDLASKATSFVSAHTTTNSEGKPTTESTTVTSQVASSASSADASATGTTTNGALARPTAVGAAAAGMAGMLGLMAAL
ncbi:hypothetical protein N7492_009956 [Penicillium capsulatum]|uniref:GPI anchored protein n=1 Tax=Penicillium capsulatum TaxID=69766 RepID=A0A9W9HLI1_9EURO|nr:hypothetical protein N7492_009956 [Penicillium capsulatum]